MTLRIEVAQQDLVTSRFAISPLWELTQALRTLAGPPSRDDAALRPWLVRVRDHYQRLARDADLAVLHALQPPNWGADFLSPVPASVSTTIEELLAQVRATPIDEVQHEVGEALSQQPGIGTRVRSILTGGQAAAYCADILAAAWQALLESEWPTLRAILERDVIHRAGQLTSKGWAAALDGLHPQLAWQPGRIELTRWPGQQDAALAGRGLLFVPSVFIWPRLAVSLEPPWPPALIYPARGVPALWETAAPSPRPAAGRGPRTAAHSARCSAAHGPPSCAPWTSRPAPPSWRPSSASPSAGWAATSRSCAGPACWPGPGPAAPCCTGGQPSVTPWSWRQISLAPPGAPDPPPRVRRQPRARLVRHERATEEAVAMGGTPTGADLERLLAERGTQLMRVAIALAGGRDAGEDLLQAALERVLRKPRQVDEDTEGYLRQVLYNLAADGWRRRGRWRQRLPLLRAQASSQATTQASDGADVVTCATRWSGCCASCRRGSAR